MNEIEVKILDIDPVLLRKKLKELGAKKQFSHEMHAIHYDTPNQDLHNKGQMLRLRGIGQTTELCWKGKKSSGAYKVREEQEVTTASFDQTKIILNKLGYKIIREEKKHRESYQLEDIHVELDTLPGLPIFAEIEAPTEEKVKFWVKKLGYTMEQTSTLTSFEIKQHYENTHTRKT